MGKAGKYGVFKTSQWFQQKHLCKLMWTEPVSARDLNAETKSSPKGFPIQAMEKMSDKGIGAHKGGIGGILRGDRKGKSNIFGCRYSGCGMYSSCSMCSSWMHV